MVSFSDLQFAIKLLSPAMTLLITGFLAIVVIYKNHKHEINRVFFLWMLISALNSFFWLGYLLFEGQFSYWIAVFVGILDPCFALHFVMLFSVGKKWISHKWSSVVFYLPAVFMILLIVPSRLGMAPPLQTLVSLYTLLMFTIEFFSIIILVISYRKTTNRIAKMQIVLITLGILIMSLGFYVQIALQIMVSMWTSVLLNLILVPVASILLAFTVLRFQLMGVESVIKKGIVFSVLSFIVVCVFILGGEVLEFVFQDIQILGQHVPDILIAVIIALSILPLQHLLDKIMNKVFPKREDMEMNHMRLETYRTALKTAYEDKKLSEKEERLLNKLRESLEITDIEHEKLILGIDSEE